VKLRVIEWPTPIGPISVTWENNRPVELSFGKALKPLLAETPEEKLFGRELKEYFAGKRCTFSFEWVVQGTPFQKLVWDALTKIPYGQTRTYSEIAKELKRPQSQRAVGNAVGKNPLPILIPCHRVVRSNGSIGGFSGGASIKPKLLHLEGISGF
jgi:methylated-DNA-[protein]-cysteine S-methyltransferase